MIFPRYPYFVSLALDGVCTVRSRKRSAGAGGVGQVRRYRSSTSAATSSFVVPQRLTPADVCRGSFVHIGRRGVTAAVEATVRSGQSVGREMIDALQRIARSVIVRRGVRTGVAIFVRRAVRRTGAVSVSVLVFVGRFVRQAGIATVGISPGRQVGIVKVVGASAIGREVQPPGRAGNCGRRVRAIRTGSRTVWIAAGSATVGPAVAAGTEWTGDRGVQGCRPREGGGPSGDDRLNRSGT